jgi:hypothetical protein
MVHSVTRWPLHGQNHLVPHSSHWHHSISLPAAILHLPTTRLPTISGRSDKIMPAFKTRQYCQVTESISGHQILRLPTISSYNKMFPPKVRLHREFLTNPSININRRKSRPTSALGRLQLCLLWSEHLIRIGWGNYTSLRQNLSRNCVRSWIKSLELILRKFSTTYTIFGEQERVRGVAYWLILLLVRVNIKSRFSK